MFEHYSAVQCRNSCEALVPIPSLGHTGVHVDTDMSLCSFCLWQPTHASTRFTCTSWFTGCGKQGKQRGKCCSFPAVACYSHLRRLWMGKLYLHAAVLSDMCSTHIASTVCLSQPSTQRVAFFYRFLQILYSVFS